MAGSQGGVLAPSGVHDSLPNFTLRKMSNPNASVHKEPNLLKKPDLVSGFLF